MEIENKNIEKKEEVKKDLFNELRTRIAESREKYRKQLMDIKEKIEINQREAELFRTLKEKLEGAIEASDGYLKAVLPSNK